MASLHISKGTEPNAEAKTNKGRGYVMPVIDQWFTLATAGETVDGRVIEEQWLHDMAERYDPNYYTAVIDADHELDYFGAYGHVAEVRLGNKVGRVSLEGKLNANFRLMEMNRMGQRLWFSIWPKEVEGKWYLFRLAVTDKPSSIGTDMMKFSALPNGEKPLFTEPKPLEFTVQDNQSDKFTSFMGGLRSLMDRFSTHSPIPQTQEPEQDEDAMTPEQMKQLTTAFTSAIEAQGEKFTAAIAELKKSPDTATPPAGDEGNDKQFSAAELSKTLKAIQDGQKNLEEQFAELKKTPGNNTQFTEFTGPSEDDDVSGVC